MLKVPQTVPTFRNVICIRNAVKRSGNNVNLIIPDYSDRYLIVLV